MLSRNHLVYDHVCTSFSQGGVFCYSTHSHPRGLGGSTLQFQREAVGTGAAVNGPFWERRQAGDGHSEISQETLVEMIGTTRACVSFFMSRFRKLGFVHYDGGLHVHSSLLNIILHDEALVFRLNLRTGSAS